MKRLIFAAAVFFAAPSVAQDMEAMAKAGELASLLASEELCGLTYDQAAISTWIEENTDPSDMSFAGNLNMYTQGNAHMYKDQSASARTAHCASIERAAKHYGFIT